MTGLSFVGKSTLFSRVALSPQPAASKMPLKANASPSINNSLGGGNSMMQTNNQSTTINNTTQLSKTMRSTTSTFKDVVQRGVLSGIGLLKK